VIAELWFGVDLRAPSFDGSPETAVSRKTSRDPIARGRLVGTVVSIKVDIAGLLAVCVDCQARSSDPLLSAYT
jgi:hypothetical protein